MTDLQLNKLLSKFRKEDEYRRAMKEADLEKIERELLSGREALLPFLRPATIDEYKQWLKDFLEMNDDPWMETAGSWDGREFDHIFTAIKPLSIRCDARLCIILSKGLLCNVSGIVTHLQILHPGGLIFGPTIVKLPSDLRF